MDLSTVSLKSATALSETYKQCPKYRTVLGFKSSPVSGEVVAGSPRKEGSGGCRWEKVIESGSSHSDHLQKLRSLQPF